MKKLIKSQGLSIELDGRDQESGSYIKLKYNEMLMTRKVKYQVKGNRLIKGDAIFDHNENGFKPFSEVFNEPTYRPMIYSKRDKIAEIENSIVYVTKSEREQMKRELLKQFSVVRILDEIQEIDPGNATETDS
jgi:hypothetical protein